LGPSLRKIIHNYENEVGYEIEYLFRKRKEITNITKRLTYTANITKSKKKTCFFL